MFNNERMMEDTSKMLLLGLDAVQENIIAVVLAKKEFLGSDDHNSPAWRATIWMFVCISLLNQINSRHGILERFLLKEFSGCKVTPERLRMLTTLFDPKQFGGCFFLIGHDTNLTHLIEIGLKISQRGQENRPAGKRFNDFQRIVKCLVKDWSMPINIKGGFHYLSEYYPNDYSLDCAAAVLGLVLGWSLQSF